MTHQELLQELSSAYGIATEYWSNTGDKVHAPAETLGLLLQAMGVNVGDLSEPALRQALQDQRNHQASRPLPPCVVSIEGHTPEIIVHVPDGAPAEVEIRLEDGSTRHAHQGENWNPPVQVGDITWGEASFYLPDDLPLGWHELILHSEAPADGARCSLIITPESLEVSKERRTGVMAQLYSTRSRTSWGIGDFHDLGLLAETVADFADFILINPMHAGEPFPPIEDSPYLPTTRRFINPIYLHVEDLPEYQAADDELKAEIQQLAQPLKDTNTSAEVIHRNPIFEIKLQVLRELYAQPRSDDRQRAYAEFCQHEGQGLVDFAHWCAQEELTRLDYSGQHARTPDSSDVADFYMWLQFLCDEQWEAAQQRALAAGMSIGIMADLAVGVHPGGADAHNLADVLAPQASVGAPPDPYNTRGQDWSQPPWNPIRLAEDGYRPWRDLLRSALHHAGGLRIDHILGLFRLFWMPRMQPPARGTYVHYDYEALVGILALEAHRAQAVVVGEDLGTFEPWVQDVLSARGILGTSVLWFESEGDQPKPAEHYRQLCLASVTTHDMPPCAGQLNGSHIALRERLGLLDDDAATEDAAECAWQNKILDTAAAAGCFHDTALEGVTFQGQARDDRGSIEDQLIGLHRFISQSPALLTCTSLVDLVGDVRSQNQPGTTREDYPNWCVPLCDGSGTPVLIEELLKLPMVSHVAEAARR
ncbi:4-alpha-glucanotransferase [Corynebacterium poyangense]|uniref:4-alpha-glucanotransferase n=1 Tax=Corynebacterium poyangense TaxID=2684405 RepID=A0A7H0SQ23_9CORY|nr:4-alpha-glucanotransferase [Corynebacterium poyangense]MBZ8178419.1 4-alpha-glucanotransferase [Corynebacterium poyangense]QNQ90648.1 4-alpha-glucanotransferase [Corynebacterium poyangense]